MSKKMKRYETILNTGEDAVNYTQVKNAEQIEVISTQATNDL